MRIGIIGTGRIAKRFVPEALSVDGIEISLIYNPHPGRAESFAEECCSGGSVRTAEKPEEIWDQIDAAYIASPHETHYSYIKDCLGHGKHVLCEKPMVLSVTQAEECFRLASEKHLVLMEGIKTAWCPGYRKLLNIAVNGCIGEIKYIDSCFTKLEDEGKRELTDIRFGGSFTELGSYVLLPILDLFGSGYGSVGFSRIDNALGLDIFTTLDLRYRGRMARAQCGLGVKAEGRLLIAGTKGFIKVDAPWWKTTHFEVHYENPGRKETYDEPFEKDGLRYELREFLKQIRHYEADTMELASARSLCMADLMERFLSARRIVQ